VVPVMYLHQTLFLRQQLPIELENPIDDSQSNKLLTVEAMLSQVITKILDAREGTYLKLGDSRGTWELCQEKTIHIAQEKLVKRMIVLKTRANMLLGYLNMVTSMVLYLDWDKH